MVGLALGTFKKIATYLKKDGVFIFSWHHTLNYCVAWLCNECKDIIEDDKLIFHKSYYDESYFTMPVDGSEIILCNRKISTYINALAQAGFAIEQMIEQTDKETMESIGDDSNYKQSFKEIILKLWRIKCCIRMKK